MNEFHICRACGTIVQPSSDAVTALCAACGAASWWITPNSARRWAEQAVAFYTPVFAMRVLRRLSRASHARYV